MGLRHVWGTRAVYGWAGKGKGNGVEAYIPTHSAMGLRHVWGTRAVVPPFTARAKEKPGWVPGLWDWMGLGLFCPALHDDGGVGATEAEGVGERVVNPGWLWLVGDVVEAALGIEFDDVHGRGGDLVLHGHDGDAGFESPGASEEVSSHGFGGTDEQGVVECALAEDIFDGLGFEGVTEGCGGGVCVDVVDLVGRDAGDSEGVGHGTVAAFAFGGHSGHVEGICGHAVADDFGEDFGAASLGELKLFEDEDASAFAADEAVTVLVPGTAGVGGVVVASGEGLHGGETTDTHGGDGGLGATGDHGVGIAALDDAEGVTDGVGAGGAGGSGGLVGSAGGVLDGDVSGGEIDDGGGDEEGRDFAWATVHHVGVFALNDVEAADAGADVYAEAVTELAGDGEAGVSHGLGCGRKGEVYEAAHFAGLFFVDEEEWIEVLDLCGEADGVAGEIECLDLRHATLAGHEPCPHFGSGVAYCAEQADTGNDDTTLLQCLRHMTYFAPFWFFSM